MTLVTNGGREDLSALVDGQLTDAGLDAMLLRLAHDDALRRDWQLYHLVGDVLRDRSHSPASPCDAFVSKLMARLAEESQPMAVAPAQSLAISALTPAPVSTTANSPLHRTEPANDPVFRWRTVGVAASVAAVALVAWTVVGPSSSDRGSEAQLAQLQAPPTATLRHSVLAVAASPTVGSLSFDAPSPTATILGGAPVMLRDPQLDDLIARRQHLSVSAPQPDGFVRRASFDVAP
jgi:sigma-E factor negative regulatory protein RseA